jgi:GH15 family glucan-1,4-alpha-glucosidase
MSADASDALTDAIGRTRAVPIGDHGFLSDGEVSALLAPDGSVSWMCVPRFDAPSVFGSILGARAGKFRIAPLDVNVPASRRYLPGTMILETSWGTPTGWVIIRDALLIGPWRAGSTPARATTRVLPAPRRRRRAVTSGSP